jgi:hypothetical protein
MHRSPQSGPPQWSSHALAQTTSHDVLQQKGSASQTHASQAHPPHPGSDFATHSVGGSKHWPSAVQPWPAGHVPHGFPQPSSPHDLPSQVHASHWNPVLQAEPSAHVPQVPKHPSEPQLFPVQSGTQSQAGYSALQWSQMSSQQSPNSKHWLSHWQERSGE